MDLVHGVTGAFILDQQHDTGNPEVQRTVRHSQHWVLQAMVGAHITLAKFQATVKGYLKYSGADRTMADWPRDDRRMVKGRSCNDD